MYMKYFEYLVKDIHSTVVATADENGLPVTCAIDIMDFDEDGLYFLTARGKNFYKRLKNSKYLSLTGLKGDDTMSSVAITLSGKVIEVGEERLPALFEKNPYMFEIYKNEESRKALTVFKIYDGGGEWFSMSKERIERELFYFGDYKQKLEGYFISNLCNGCKACHKICPRGCIGDSLNVSVIDQSTCIRCGGCFEVCPQKAIIKYD